MSSKRCQVCFSSRTVPLKDTVYCELCDIYYTMKGGRQHISTLPIKELEQASLDLCTRCRKKSGKGHIIVCRSFGDYFSKLGFCRGCKSSNRDFLKNLYYKNFLLYRTKVPLFGWRSILLLLFCLILYNVAAHSCGITLYDLVAPPSQGSIGTWMLLILVQYARHGMALRRLVFVSFLFYYLGHVSLVNDALLLYIAVGILFYRTVVFSIPSNLHCHDDLHSFIEKLSIRGRKMDGVPK